GTERGIYSLFNGFNVLNFKLLSPSYEYRLIKYAERGIAVHVPNVDENEIDYIKLEEIFQYYFGHMDKESPSISDMYNTINSVTTKLGLDMEDKTFEMYEHIKTMEDYVRDKMNIRLQNMRFGSFDILLFTDYKSRKFPFSTRLYERSIITSDYEEKSEYYNCPKSINNYFDYLIRKHHRYPKIWDNIMKNVDGRTMSGGDYLSLLCLNEYNIDVRCISGTFNIYKITTELKYIDSILYLDYDIYNIASNINKDFMSKNIEFKTKVPGDQITSTINRIILEDENLWYNGYFYKNEDSIIEILRFIDMNKFNSYN